MADTIPTARLEEIREGQIYRWRWADEARHRDGLRPWGSYHCKSTIAIVKSGLLIDTYWFGAGSEYSVDSAKVELTLIGDEKWPQVSEAEALRYDRADLCDTRHANNRHGPIYVRPGAQLNQAAILEVIGAREEDARSNLRIAQWRLEELAKSREAAEAGRLDEVRF